jgi:hypothetical protein
MQLGFDMVYTDPNTHEVVPWAMPEKSLIEAIKAAAWKIVDVETTGLNPASKEQNFSGKDLRRGVDATLRQRINSVLFYDENGMQVVSFDYDTLTSDERRQVSDASLTGVFIAHNAGFDGYWNRIHSKTKPALTLDTMLMARILAPDHPRVMARLCGDETVDPKIQQHAEMMFMAGRSGWSLADLTCGVLGRLLPKDLQGPKNWCQPFLSQQSYEYATGDVITTFDLVLALFKLARAEVDANPQILLERYQELRSQNLALAIVEPQVLDVIEMREHGMPWAADTAEAYVAKQWAKVKEFAQAMVEIEPTLAPHFAALSEPEKGVTADLKAAIGAAFSARGVELDMTEKSGQFKIGEKDLRKAKAANSPEAKLLFTTWTSLNRAKKAGGMAREFSGFSRRSFDEYLHPNTGHGPVTGRLSSSEPNCQQMPRDQGFRDCVRAKKAHKIVACDYSALDMRVGAALSLRAQHQIVEAYMGDRKVTIDVRRCIERVLEGKLNLEQAREEESRAVKAFEAWKAEREAQTEEGGDTRKRYWDHYRKLARTQLLAGFQRCLRQVRDNAEAAGTSDWGSLRDAFSIPGMDIHTWTALGMLGKDPKALFGGLSDGDVATELKTWKAELGDHRQTGKVGNLSLLYAMKTLGLMEAAAKNYNIHWTYEEADKVRTDWLAAYVEVDLWHKWTELNPVETVYIPDPDKGRYGKRDVFASRTLGDRLIYAFGLNAALSYEDQSTGADILGMVMSTLREKEPDLFAMTVNQVHDELVFMVPDETVEEGTARIQRVMTECAEHYLMPFGVRGECSPAVGDVWVKD